MNLLVLIRKNQSSFFAFYNELSVEGGTKPIKFRYVERKFHRLQVGDAFFSLMLNRTYLLP